jgi:hypothetical protein
VGLVYIRYIEGLHYNRLCVVGVAFKFTELWNEQELWDYLAKNIMCFAP